MRHLLAIGCASIMTFASLAAAAEPLRPRGGFAFEHGALLANKGGIVWGPSAHLGLQLGDHWGVEWNGAATFILSPSNEGVGFFVISNGIDGTWTPVRWFELGVGPVLDAFGGGSRSKSGVAGAGDVRARFFIGPASAPDSRRAAFMLSFDSRVGYGPFFYVVATLGIGATWY